MKLFCESDRFSLTTKKRGESQVCLLDDYMSKDIKKRKGSSGFTLVELLAVISVLAVVTGIVVYTVINIVDSTKNKSYQVSISNIENRAEDYAIENQNEIEWLPVLNDINGNSEYLCIRVQDLIDKGYFKGDVLDSKVADDTNVSANDYIYLERNTNNKTVNKNVLLFGERTVLYSGLCGETNVRGSINFKVSPLDWSKEKKVTIYYNIYNVVDNVSNYSYGYNYEEDGLLTSKKFEKNSAIDEIVYPNEQTTMVDDGGTIYASIMDGENSIVNSTFVISKIDNELPSAQITSTNEVASSQTVTLNISDNVGLTSYYFGKKDPQTTDVTWIDVENTTSLELDANVDSSGIWYLGVKDIVGNVMVTSKEFYETTLSISNAVITPATVMTMSGNEFTIPTPVVNSFYTFNGWYAISDYSGEKITVYKPTGNATLYGKTTKTSSGAGGSSQTGSSCSGILNISCCIGLCSSTGLPKVFVAGGACHCCSKGVSNPYNLTADQVCAVIVG